MTAEEIKTKADGLRTFAKELENGKLSVATARNELLAYVDRQFLATETAIPGAMTAADLLSAEYPPEKHAIERVLPDSGLVLLTSGKGLGKTWAALSMSLGVAHGGRAFGKLKCEKERTAFIELELSPRLLARRLHAMNAAPPENLDFFFEWPHGDKTAPAIEKAIKEKGYRFVVLDMLAMTWPTGLDLNDYGDAYAALSPLRRIAHEHNALIMVLHHNKKAAESDYANNILGSVGVQGVASVMLQLQRKRGESLATLLVDGNDIEGGEIDLEFSKVPPVGWSVTTPDAERRLTPEQAEVLAAVRQGIKQSGEIAKFIDKSPANTSKFLTALVNAGLLQKGAYGKYEPPDF